MGDNYEKFFQLSLDLLCVAGDDGKFKMLNSAWEQVLGFSTSELTAKPFIDFIHPEDREKTLHQYQNQMLGTDVILFENRYMCKDGSYRWLSWTATAVSENGLIYAMARDITEKKRIEKEMLILRANLQAVVEKNNDGILVVDNDGRIQFINATAEKFLSHKISAPMGQPLEAGILQGKTQEMPIRRQDGSMGIGEIHKVVTDWKGEKAQLITLRDVTQRRALEAQLRQTQKMEAVGRLAGGVAHDFNNHLAIILMSTDMLLNNLKNSTEVNDLREIKRAAERATALTRQLLAFSRQEIVQLQTLDLNNVVENMSQMFQRLIGEHIRFNMKLASQIGKIKADRGQVEQVLMNLIINARDAMPDGGTLVMETANAHLEDAYIHKHFMVRPGDYVMLSVTDTGVGMDAETQDKIFEPFFTTKEKDKGTGLGLATVYGIVQQNHGYIFVYSEVKRGTTFKVYLPRIDIDSKAVEIVKPKKTPTHLGDATILLVEDDPTIRKLVAKALVAQGFQTLESVSSLEALAMGEDLTKHIDLLITDLVMPNLGGRELGEKILAKRPKLKIIYMSGYTSDTAVLNGILNEGILFLQKPFTQNLLLDKVREALGR